MESEPNRSPKDQKVIEYLESKIKTYEAKAVQARRKVNNLNLLSNKIEKQLHTWEKTLNRYNTDDEERKLSNDDNSKYNISFKSTLITFRQKAN